MLSELQVAFAAVLGLSTLLSGVLTGIAARFRREVGADWFVATLGLVTLWNAVILLKLF